MTSLLLRHIIIPTRLFPLKFMKNSGQFIALLYSTGRNRKSLILTMTITRISYISFVILLHYFLLILQMLVVLLISQFHLSQRLQMSLHLLVSFDFLFCLDVFTCARYLCFDLVPDIIYDCVFDVCMSLSDTLS